jgi:hypothetical protein
MTKQTGVCARCGEPTTGKGPYCRKCHGWSESVAALQRTAAADAELIRQADQHTVAEIGRMTGVSRQAVAMRLAKARERQRQRQAIA